jgi:hypothetical protein
VRGLTRPEAAIVALLHKGGDRQKVDTEDVAIEAAALAPGLFSWVKYAEHVDKELVRVALSDARLKKNWTIGSHAQGWMLTPEGLTFARANERRVREQAQAGRQARDPELEKERARMLASEAYAHAQRDGIDAVTDDEADAFFRLIAYIRGQPRQRKIARLENAFRDDPEMGPLILALAARARMRGEAP